MKNIYPLFLCIASQLTVILVGGFQSQISFDPLCNILMPHVWLILLLCCCLGFPGLQFACLPRLHALVLPGTDKKLSKRGLAYKVGIFLWLVYCLI